MKENEDKRIKVNIDKALIKSKPAIIIMVFNLLSYIYLFMFGNFDFGFIFELASLLFLLIARKDMEEYNLSKSKRKIIISIFLIIALLIYDVGILIINAVGITDLIILIVKYLFIQVLILCYLLILIGIMKDLNKAENSEKYKENTDWFYENYK